MHSPSAVRKSLLLEPCVKCAFLILILIGGEWSLYMLPSVAPLATVHWENILLGVLLEVEFPEVWWLLCLHINRQALDQYKLSLNVSDGGVLQYAILVLSWTLSIHWSFVSTAFQKLTLLPSGWACSSARRSPNYRTVCVTSSSSSLSHINRDFVNCLPLFHYSHS